MDTGKARYVLRYYRHLLTERERLAYGHLVDTAKVMHGRSDWAAQSAALTKPSPLYPYLSNDPEVLNLTRRGWNVFVEQTAQRILDKHGFEIRFNYCCRCGGLARTPTAQQCRFCRHDWHKEITISE
jgi:hypothetical protein